MCTRTAYRSTQRAHPSRPLGWWMCGWVEVAMGAVLVLHGGGSRNGCCKFLPLPQSDDAHSHRYFVDRHLLRVRVRVRVRVTLTQVPCRPALA
jgi:hypothetical protein